MDEPLIFRLSQLLNQGRSQQLLQHRIHGGAVIREKAEQNPFAPDRALFVNNPYSVHAQSPIRRQSPFELFNIASILRKPLDSPPNFPSRLRCQGLQKSFDRFADDHPRSHLDIALSNLLTSWNFIFPDS